MSVNFFKHKEKLVDAYNDVLNDKSDTDWALFTYEGNNNDIKVQATGDEGLEELEGEFNNGKIMYAFVRIDDPNTNMKKYILIVWQGDGVPATRKGACANHVKDVNRFFKGSHMTLYARNDDDITPEEIMRQVRKSTSNFSFVAPKEDHSASTPVGSVYKRTNAEQEIKSSRNEKFWLKVQQEEDARRSEEKKKEAQKRRQEAVEVKERETKSEENRKNIVAAREREISEKMKAQKLADDNASRRMEEKKRWEAQEREQEAALQDIRRARRTQSIEHAQEAEQMITKRSNNPRAMWEQREKEANAPPPVRKYSSSSSRTSSVSEKQESFPPVASKPVRHVQPPPEQEPEPPQPEYQTPPEQPEPQQEYQAPPQQEYQAPPPQQEYQAPPPQQEYQAPPEPNYSAQQDYQPEPEYHQPEQVYQPEEAYQPEYQPEPTYQEGAYQSEEPNAAAVYEEAGFNQESVYDTANEDQSQQGLNARALYDYQAEDEGEISFDPGDIIYNIEQIDPGWWKGQTSDGSYGLFPANYVELI
ncbi:drebrin-like protein B isoform X1 [Clavelina lepadiformis]|uniref:drebrin-like protein B isoform X1 n=2 Tax=Clavelina lepadiformis TaxID=159417 RepID=UPI0040412E68